MADLERVVWPQIENGTIKPIVDTVIPIEEADRAHELVAADQTFGKVYVDRDMSIG